MRKLIVGESYVLQYTKDFCHRLTSKGFKTLSKKRDGKVKAIFVGEINLDPTSSTMKRNIFFDNTKGEYIMFDSSNTKYIKE